MLKKVVNRQTIRNFSIVARMQSYIGDIAKNRQDKQVEQSKVKLFKELNEAKEFDLNSYYSMLDEAIKESNSGIKSFLPKPEAEMAELEGNKRIIEAMSYTQRLQFKNIRSESDRELIAMRSGQPVEKVNTLLQTFAFFHTVWNFMNTQKKDVSEDKLPKSLDEVIESMRISKKGIRKPPPVWQLEDVNRKTRANLFEEARNNQPKEYLDAYHKIVRN